MRRDHPQLHLKVPPRSAWTSTVVSDDPETARSSGPSSVPSTGAADSAFQTPEVSNLEELVAEGSRSPSSSLSSKRTGLSADFTSQIRQRIRQQAQSLISKKRGSVQLARRLLRSQTLTTSATGDSSPAESQIEVDRQIEAAVAAGKRFIETDDEEKDTAFVAPPAATSDDAEKGKSKTAAKVVYCKSVPQTLQQVEAFKTLLTMYGTPSATEKVEVADPLHKMGSTLFTISTPRSFDKFFARVGANRERALQSFGLQMTNITDQPLWAEEIVTEDDVGLVAYEPAVKWSEWEVQDPVGDSGFFMLRFELDRIEFDHHWLFTREDALALRVRRLYDDVMEQGEKAIDLIQGYLSATLSGVTETALEALEQTFSTTVKEFSARSTELEAAYETLEAERRTLAKPTTAMELCQLQVQDIEGADERLPTGMHSFMSLVPLYVLENVEPEYRPKALSKLRLQVNIYFNDILVCKSESVQVASSFVAYFNRGISMKVFDLPESVSLVIRENHPRHGWVDLARVFVPLPTGDIPDFLPPDMTEFGSDLVVEPQGALLGSGQPHKSSPCLLGRVFYRIRMANAEQVPSLEERLAEERQQKLKARKMAQQTEPAQNCFQLIPDEVRISSDDDFRTNARFNALERRFKASLLHREEAQRPIAIQNNEIDPFWLDEDPRMTGSRGPAIGQSRIEALRSVGHQYAVLIRNHLVEQFASVHRIRSYADVVREDSFSAGFSGFGNIFGQIDISRKLKPMRVQEKAVAVTNKLSLILNIQSAVNLPQRVGNKPMNVLVDCRFRQKKMRTLTVSGRSANWQQTFVVEIANGRNGQLDLRAMTDVLELTVYDQEIAPLPHDDREPNTIHEQVERRWLGSVQVPFSTIYSLGKIDGLLPLKKPFFLTGYEMPQVATFLKVMITLDPAVASSPVNNNELFAPGEDPATMALCARFETHHRSLHPDRRTLALVTDANGRRVVPSRFICPLRPPPQVMGLLENGGTMIQAVRLATHIVASIPPVSDPVSFPGTCDVWTTTEQLLTIGCGAEEEHSVLLACWLLHLHLNVALLLGRSVPEGLRNAFVYVDIPPAPENNYGGFCVVINACDGAIYPVKSVIAPLSGIGTAVTSSNVFANIQKTAHPSSMDFDLSKKSSWDPLFLGASDRTALTTVQHTELSYVPVNDEDVVELRASLEREIKLRFDEARQYGIPQWNLMISRNLREMLSEADAFLEAPADVDYRLAQLQNIYDIRAVAFTSCFSSKDRIVDEVLRTNVHVNSNRNAQFALAVHVRPFVNQVVSVSIAIASLTPKYF